MSIVDFFRFKTSPFGSPAENNPCMKQIFHSVLGRWQILRRGSSELTVRKELAKVELTD